ncbi:glycosyltransferase family 2 protein, partial [Bacillus toyonensis]
PTLSKHSIQNGLGTHHLVTLDELEAKYLSFATSTIDLRLIPEYQVLFPDLCFPNH